MRVHMAKALEFKFGGTFREGRNPAESAQFCKYVSTDCIHFLSVDTNV